MTPQERRISALQAAIYSLNGETGEFTPEQRRAAITALGDMFLAETKYFDSQSTKPYQGFVKARCQELIDALTPIPMNEEERALYYQTILLLRHYGA